MIGVIANPSDEGVVREFFELFKTPWEFYRGDRQYEVLLCTDDRRFEGTAKCILLYSGRRTQFDREHNVRYAASRVLLLEGNRIPIYGDTVTFPQEDRDFLWEECSQQSAAYVTPSAKGTVVRIGYDLFSEVRTLLTAGQPAANAHTPTLELHISLLRDSITGCGLPLVEVPPVPEGYPFIMCLTHDVDHPSLRQHRWDHTIFGFLYRAVVGSVANVIDGRRQFRDLVKNWIAVSKLPFVFLDLAKDFWCEFDDCYLKMEDGLPSTFFLIAFKDNPGEGPEGGRAPAFRASKYAARDLANTIDKLTAAGCEIGLHGVDAWRDSSKGRKELDEIRHLTGTPGVGVRMHWLYYDQDSPAALEKAGAEYDSTIGYSETVGYRAGTIQAYKPLQAGRLLELPLQAMDTALFYPAHLHLSMRKGRTLVDRMIEDAIQFGGCLTINWHDRSIFPERLWGECYRDLIDDLRIHEPWFATARQAVSWFRKRRAVTFETDCSEPGGISAKVMSEDGENLPRLRMRVREARHSIRDHHQRSEGYIDIPFDKSVDAFSAVRLAHE
jgi:hypothetical protein